MDFGFFLMTQFGENHEMRGVGEKIVTQTELANDVGFDHVNVGEHHATETYRHLNNEAMLANVADRTGDMWLNATLCLLPYHNPVRIAELGATLDILSGGRFRLGVGLGYRPEEYEVFGITKKDAVERLNEGVEIVKRLWTEDAVSYDGDRFTLDEVSIRPQPLQRPRPPVWFGASNESSIRRGARLGDGFLGAHVPFDIARRQVEVFRDEREKQGLSTGEVGFIREVYVAETKDEAERIAREPLMEKYDRYSTWGQDDAIEEDEFGSHWDRLREERFIVGSPDYVVSELGRYRDELDVDHIVIRTQFPTMEFDEAHDSLRLFGREVIPEL